MTLEHITSIEIKPFFSELKGFKKTKHISTKINVPKKANCLQIKRKKLMFKFATNDISEKTIAIPNNAKSLDVKYLEITRGEMCIDYNEIRFYDNEENILNITNYLNK